MKTVRAVDRALKTLFVVAMNETPLTLTAVSQQVGLDKATTLRLLFTLEQAQLVKKDPRTRSYVPGAGILTLAQSWRNDLRKASRPALEALGRMSGEAVSLICARGLERVVIDVVPGSHELSVVPTIGSTQPIYAGASGKIFMAYMEEDERQRIIKLTALKPVSGTMGNKHRYLDEIENVRRNGYAFSCGDVTVGASAVAAPIFDALGAVAGVLAVRGPDIRMPLERAEKLAPTIIDFANQISWKLGFDAEHRQTA